MLRDTCIHAISLLARNGIMSPATVCRLRYILKFRKIPRQNPPRDLNEKIMWLEFNTDTTEWTRLSDKVEVRSWLAGLGLDRYAPRLLAVWDSADAVDLTSLPARFVIKPNNGFGSILIVRDKSAIDIDSLRPKLSQWIEKPFGIETGEPHYARIPRRILAEELLEPPTGYSAPLVDYKFWCVNGRAVACLTCSNRDFDTHRVDLAVYDLPSWTPRPDAIHPSFRNSSRVEKPEALAEMITLAERLAAPFPLVRVDLYYVGGKVYFGEMTFTSNGARMRYFTDKYLLELGEQAVLDLPPRS